MSKGKKVLLIATVLLIGVAGIGCAAYVISKDKEPNTISQSESTQPITQKACELFSLHEAEKILGGSVKQVDSSSTAPKASDSANSPAPVPEVKSDTKPTDGIESTTFTQKPQDTSKLQPTTCTYLSQSQEGESVIIAVLPNTDSKAKSSFDAGATSDAKKIAGLGSEAYWRTGKDMAGTETGQLAILYGGGVVTISSGNNDMEQARKVASAVEDNLNEK